MENTDFLNKNNAETQEKARPIPSEPKTIGDIDELIFPDDEPYYISER